MKNSNNPAVWIDLVSPSHPFFFASLASELPEVSFTTTVREKTETVDLAKEVGFKYTIFGRDFNNTLLRKVGIPLRTAQLAIRTPFADVSLSSRNAMCVIASKSRGIPSIHFTDNDITAHVDGLQTEKLYNCLEAQATHNVVPAAFDQRELTRWGATHEQIHSYDGYKEDVYVATFEPDNSFLEQLPFAEYVVIRPEALDAAYVDAERSLVPDLLERLVEAGENVVYLPRGRGDDHHRDYPDNRVYAPENALNGLQLAWYSDCVLTGSGTMAREAACMHIPAVSFFPNKLLSVDGELVDEGRVLHSRDPDEITEYILSRSKADKEPDLTQSKKVRDEVVDIVDNIIIQETNNNTFQ